MKKIYLYFVLASFFAFGTNKNVKAQLANWSQTSGTTFPTNQSGQIHGMTRIVQLKHHQTDTNKMYALTAEGGLFVTSDKGENWTVKAGTEHLTGSCASICIDYTNDQTIWLGSGDPNYYTNGQGILKSTDGGNSFVATTLINCLVVHITQNPLNATQYIAATNKGIYRSDNSGSTWIAKTATNLQFVDMVMNPGVNSQTLYACTKDINPRLYKSLDFGATWTEITGFTYATANTTGGARIGLTPADTNVVYYEVIGGGGIIHKSNDGGNSFTVKKAEGQPYITFYDGSNSNGLGGQGNYNNCVWVDRNDPAKIWLQSHSTWYSSDSGATWTMLTHWASKIHTDMHQLQQAPFNNNLLIGLNDGGVWFSTDGGNNWTAKTNGIAAYEVASNAGKSSMIKKDFVSIGTQDNGRLYSNANGWFTIKGGDDYAKRVTDFNGHVYYDGNKRQTNHTGSEQTYALPTANWNDIAFNRTNVNLAFMGVNDVWRTTDLSATTPTWTQISTFNSAIRSVHSCIADPNKLYVLLTSGDVYVSADALAPSPTFTLYILPSTANQGGSVVAMANNANIVYVAENTAVYRSSNGGQNWTNVTYNLPAVIHRRILSENYGGTSELVFIATNNAVYYKKAGQTSWTNYSSNLPSRRAPTDFSMFDDGSNNARIRYATYGRSVWESKFGNLRAVSSGFDANITYHCSPGTAITFNDQSTGNVNSWTWSFPGGTPSTSTAQNPSITYNAAGAYTATLTSTDGVTSSTITKTNYIVVLASAPTVNTGCTIASNSNLNNGFGVGISYFGLENISNGTSGNNGHYSDYTCSQYTFLTAGSTYYATVSTGTGNAEGAALYIDLNDNGIFESGELMTTFPSNITGTRTLPIIIPSSGVQLNKGLRLRIVSRFNAIPNSACNVSTYGQAEDYTVYITSSSSAMLANGSGASIICSGSSANLKVTINGGTSPYTVVISDGSSTQTITSYTSSSDISVSPTSNTTYTLVSVTDNGGNPINPISGIAIVNVNSNTTSSGSETACNSYTWNGNTYTASGAYTHTSLNANNCTHTATLNLTINTNSTSSSSETACNSYTWNGNTYTASGTYTHTSLNANNCIHTATLNLTIHTNSTSSSSETACTSYTWNGNTYTASGTYTHTSLNANNCIHTATLNLTIHTNSTSSSSETACSSYTWNGNTYTASGIYTHTSLNANNCTHTATLNLIINNATTSTSSITACGSYTWSANGITYTVSGTYVVTSPAANIGCSHSEILNLTITSNVISSISASACDNYMWSINNQTYTVSGIYTATVGCTTHELNLSINNSTSFNYSITQNSCYTWSLNNMTYTVSGLYTYTNTNSTTGCLETHHLNLVINLGVYLNANVLLGGAYDVNTGLMHDSLRTMLPLTEPYTNAPYGFAAITCASGETTNGSILGITGNNAIVDWIFLELRDASNVNSVVATKRALLQRDGDIVSHVDGTSPVYFDGVAPANYWISVKHRNHLGVMTNTTIALSNCTFANVLFSTNPVYIKPGIMNTPRKTVGTIYPLWSADCNNNKNMKYNGLSNDKDKILTAIGGPSIPNNIITGYRMEDANLDRKVRYNGVDNDRVIILNNIGANTPNNILYQHTPN